MTNQQLKISEVIDLAQEQFTKNAPATMKYSAERGFAIQLLQNNSYLMKVAHENPISLQQAVANVAAIGLSLNPAEKLAYLIPRTVKVNNQFVSKIFLEPSYVGLIKLATDSGSIDWVQANIVYANDEFTDNGVGEKPTHKYSPFANVESRGEFVGTYCVAKTGSDYLTTMMSSTEVFNIRGRSESFKKYGKGVWVTDFNEMAKKSVVRRAFKTWTRTNVHTPFAEAVELSNKNEGFEPIVTSPNLGDTTAGQKEFFDQLIEKSDAMGMHLLSNDLDTAKFQGLYHSFEKGTKGKYQSVVDKLVREGIAMVKEYRESLESATNSNDRGGALQIISEISEDELKLVASGLSSDAVLFVESVD